MFTNVLDTIKRHKKFLVTTHSNPDADAVASALSMALFLRHCGKKAVLFNEDPCPQWLRFLPGAAMFKKVSDAGSVDYDAAIVLDCGDLKRTGKVRRLIRKDRPLINIDHHVTNDKFGSINVIRPKASSTCEVVYDLLTQAGFTLNRNVAVLLYAGIITDTGSFHYENTSAHSHAVVEKLMAFRISAAVMYERLYPGIPAGDIKRFTDLIHKAKLVDGNRVYCVSLSKKGAASFSKSFDLKEKIFSFLRSTQGVEIAVILTELSRKEVRVNLRSCQRFNVATLARQFEGGGHKRAAGCRVYSSLARAEKTIFKAIHKMLV